MNTDLTPYQTFKETNSMAEMQRMVQGKDGWQLLNIRTRRPEPEESGAFEEELIYLLGTTAKWP
jgi:hypothetical protein